MAESSNPFRKVVLCGAFEVEANVEENRPRFENLAVKRRWFKEPLLNLAIEFIVAR
jgi:hypothetical protein